MAVEAPANISMIGLNPLSLEAALYGRFLGYHISIYGRRLEPDWAVEANPKVDPLQQTTSLGWRAIEAQFDSIDRQSQMESISDRQSLFENYISRLTKTDLLCDSICERCHSVKAYLAEDELPEKLEQDVEYDTRVFELELGWDLGNEQTETESDSGSANGESIRPKCDVLIDFRTKTEVDLLDCKTDFPVVRHFETAEFQAERPSGEQLPLDDLRRLMTSEPDYYVLGELSVPTESEFDFQTGVGQIRDLFKILSDRKTLDLYAN